MTTSANANNGERSNENPFDKLTEQETKMIEQLTRIDVDPRHANEMAPKLVAQGLIDLQRVKYFFKDCDQKQFYEKVQGRKYGMKDWSAMKLWDHLQTMTESKTDGQDESKTDGQDESKTDGQDESKSSTTKTKMTKVPSMNWRLEALRNECSKRGLSAEGGKSVLLNRLKTNPGDENQYAGWKKYSLQEELHRLGISGGWRKATKDELISRLRDHHEANSDSDLIK
jgi:hypothetical protein